MGMDALRRNTIFSTPAATPKHEKQAPQCSKHHSNDSKSNPEGLRDPFCRELGIQASKNIAQSATKDAKPQTPPKIGPKPPQNPLKNTNEKTIAFGSVFSRIFLVFGPQKPSIFHHLFQRVKIKNALKFKAFLT